MKALRIFLQLLFFGSVIAETSFIYNGFHNVNLSLSEESHITPDGILSLTSYSPRVIGNAFYPAPLKFKQNTSVITTPTISFSTTFVVSISPMYTEIGGHGLAFILSSTKDLQGCLSNEYLGLPNDTSIAKFSTHLLAVEFDVVQNIELSDINDNHVGIDINSLISNISEPAAYFSGGSSNQNLSIDLKSGAPFQAWIEYSGEEKLMNVTISPLGIRRPDRPLISFPLDLSSLIDEYMYVGFSASTGMLSAAHNVLGWSFRIDGRAEDLKSSKIPSLVKAKNLVHSKAFVVGIALASVTLFLLMISGALQVARRLKHEDDLLEEWEVEYGAHKFRYSELLKATGKFEERNLIGRGGFGCVYRGVIRSTGLEVAIKKVAHDSRQGMKEFVAEITSMGRLRHRNLVGLHGWCRRNDELLLVYDFIPNGSLDKLLYNQPKKILTWEQRYKILIGVAEALLYLHEECDQRVIHRDVKSSNVLIDADLNARLGDFGLSKIYDHGINPQTTHIVGTLGYLAPEFTRTAKATTSLDVYSYGALMLEVACGRRPIEPQKNALELVLVDWVRELHSQKAILRAIDPLLDFYNPVEAELVLSLGLLCSHPLPHCRPSMRRVVQFLLGDATLPHLPSDVHLELPGLVRESLDAHTSFSELSSSRMTSLKSISTSSSSLDKNSVNQVSGITS
ncbi:L-type lectin-domain containing receptor kinase SIT2-like [Telopea speciosissima]|uniref:L-type lectin-domain containing receptor kinase SIT2-like n=1 Tax=Telopea speciosissima TaxID=54955 RepID=UPI001CC42DDE|nr:L-type lectin-domain containing receptor kinase SIT2-like [Telopea speciosissima]